MKECPKTLRSLNEHKTVEQSVLTEKADELYLMTLNWKSLVAGVGRGRARRRARNEAQARCRSRVEVAIDGTVSRKTAGDWT